MNKVEARNIGTSFLKNKKFDINDFGERNKLGKIFDYNIFYSFPVVHESGESYLGGNVLLLDKRTKFCLLVASSPNFFEYHVRLFRIIKLQELYDEEIDFISYRKKATNLNLGDFVQAIFLLLESYPNNLNAFLVFLDFLILFEEEPIKDEIIKKLSYKAVAFNSGTLEIFCKGYKIFKNNTLVQSKINDLERNLLNKELTLNDLFQENDKNIQAYEKEIEDMKAFMKKEESKNS